VPRGGRRRGEGGAAGPRWRLKARREEERDLEEEEEEEEEEEKTREALQFFSRPSRTLTFPFFYS